MKSHTNLPNWIRDAQRLNSVNSLYLNINEINGFIEGNNRKKYLRLVPTGESKETKKYEELKNKIRDPIRSITSNSGNCDENNMKITFSSDDDLPLKKKLKLYNEAIVVRSVQKISTKIFLDECLYNLLMLQYDKVDVSKGLDVN